MRTIKKCIVIIFLSLLLFSCSADKKKSVEHYILAKEFYKNEDIKNASSEIDIAIALDSSNLDFQIMKAKIISETDNYEHAIEILQKLISQNFKLDTVNYNIGSCYSGCGFYYSTKQYDEDKANEAFEKSLSYFNSAISINTKYYDAYVKKNKALHNLKRYDEALIVINTAINLFPDSIFLICLRGTEKIFLGDLTGAMNDLNTCISCNKLDSIECATAYRFRGHIHHKIGNINNAINDLTIALKFEPENGLIFWNRAECYKDIGLKNKACEDYKKAADLGFVSIYKEIKEYCSE